MNQNVHIYYFDVMKGIAITLMVIGHIMLFAFGINLSEPSKCIYFNMPLFFYISGYLAYRKFETFRYLVSRMISRGMVLLIPYVILFSVYSIFSKGTLLGITELTRGSGRYWFLYDLFLISTFFMVIEYLVRSIKNNWVYCFILILPLTILICLKMNIFHFDQMNENIGALIERTTNYYRYYLIGYFCRKYVKFNNLLFSSTIVCAIGLVAYFANWYFYNYHNLVLNFLGTLGAIVALQTYVCRYITDESKICRLFSMLGRCSLGIYVLHYFFIPDLSGIMCGLINCGNPFIWQLTIATCIAVPIIAASIFLYRIIEMNKLLFLICFGKRYNK